MPKAKFKAPLLDGIYAVITIEVLIPRQVEMVADAMGVGKQERENLCGQKLSEIIQLLGNDEEV